MTFTEQYSGQFALAVEDRSARVTLSCRGGYFNHLERELHSRRDILRAGSAHCAVGARAIASDGERFTRSRARSASETGCAFGLRMAIAAKSQSRSAR